MLSTAPLGTLSNMNRVQQPAPPHLRFNQAGLPFSPGFTGHQETEISFQIFVGIVVIQFQGTGRIHFASHQLLDLAQPKLLEGKRRIDHIAVVGQGMQQAHHQPMGDVSLIQIAFVEFQLIGGVRKHANLTAHRRVWTRGRSCLDKRTAAFLVRLSTV